MRDSQRQKVYNSELMYLRQHSTNVYLGDIDRCQLFVDQVLKRRYVQKHYDTENARIKVVGSPNKHRWAHAYCGSGLIELGTGENARWSRTTAVVLHEIAHILAYRRYLEHTGGHDWAFAKTFHDLVRNVMSKDAADCLRTGYRVYKVRTAPRRTRVMSEEQKNAQRVRLREARVKREIELAPKRLMKERLIRMHTKHQRGYNSFGNMTHFHLIGSGDRRMQIEMDPKYMTYAQIEGTLQEYDERFNPKPVPVVDPAIEHIKRLAYQEFSAFKPDPAILITGLTD